MRAASAADPRACGLAPRPPPRREVHPADENQSQH